MDTPCIGTRNNRLADDDNALRVYNGKYSNTISIAIVVCKIDVADILIEELLRRLEEFLERLQRNGIGFSSIDCTRDFSRCLDRKVLLDHHVSEHDLLQQKVLQTTQIGFWRTTRMWATKALCIAIKGQVVEQVSMPDRVCKRPREFVNHRGQLLQVPRQEARRDVCPLGRTSSWNQLRRGVVVRDTTGGDVLGNSR